MSRWVKGQSGNPGGRRKQHGDLRDLARSHAAAAVDVLAAIMGDETAPPASRVSAAVAILDRGHGKPPQSIAASVNRDCRDMTDVELLTIIQAVERDEDEGDEAPEALH